MRVTLALMTFNQAPFLAEAIESALAQDYSPLRIHISDNGSRDGTPEIIQHALKSYNGPHQVMATRFDQNTGSPSSHLNTLAAQLEDEIVVLQAGDDRSHKGRVSAIAQAFAANPKAQLVYHAWDLIDAQGRPGRKRPKGAPPQGDPQIWFAPVSRYALGATLAVRKSLLLDWPPLPAHVFEDVVLPFRAALCGPVIYLENALLDYRKHSGGTIAPDHRLESLAGMREIQGRSLERLRQIGAVRRDDLAFALKGGKADVPQAERLAQVIEQSLKMVELQSNLISPSRKNRLQAIRQLWRFSLSPKDRVFRLAIALWPQAWFLLRRWRQER